MGCALMQANAMEVQNVTITRARLGIAWRWRSEIGLLTSGTTGFFECWHCIGLDLTGAALGGGVALAVTLPWSRRFLAARFWCLVTRHRLQTVMWELRLHTRSFRLPLVLWTRPTPVGERVFLLLRAGLSADDFTSNTAELATACGAREVRVTPVRWNSALIVLDVIRRDLLAPGRVVATRLPDGPVAVPDWLALPDDLAPAADLVPVPESSGWPDIAPEGDEL
jgi:hypothetical protein